MTRSPTAPRHLVSRLLGSPPARVLLLIGIGLYTAGEFALMALNSRVFVELLFRGVLFRPVKAWFGSWAALVVSSLVFGLGLLSCRATRPGKA